MGYRLSKIYTRTGDDGTTGLGDGSRVAKDSARVEAYGTVDETNCGIGMLLAIADLPAEVRTVMTRVQHELFDLGAELCMPGLRAIGIPHIERLERELDRLNDALPPLKDFILPGGGPASAAAHLARTICRRAERRVCSLAHDEPVAAEALQYLNRLSDLLFVIARLLARHENGSEITWRGDRDRTA